MGKRSVLRLSRNVAVILLTTTVLLAGALELLVRWGVIAPSFSQPDSFSLIFDHDMLFRVKPDGRYDINGQGYRDYHDFTRPKMAGMKRVLFLGDSFVMGLNVISTHTMPKQLEQILGEGYEVFNLGVHGYGPDQSLAQLEKEGMSYNPDIVILNICAQNDYRDIEKNRLYLVDTGGSLSRSPRNAISGIVPASNALYIAQYLLWKNGIASREYAGLFYTLFVDSYDIDMLQHPASTQNLRDVELMRGILRKFRQELTSRNILLLVTIMPSFDNIVDETMLRQSNIPREKYFFIEEKTAEICKQEGIPFINLYPIFGKEKHPELIYDPADHHLSDFGNHFVAEIIRNSLVATGNLPGH